ncbi:MAG: hypothetical protein ACREU3_12005 [Steroidobacteraceae bacterium]
MTSFIKEHGSSAEVTPRPSLDQNHGRQGTANEEERPGKDVLVSIRKMVEEKRQEGNKYCGSNPDADCGKEAKESDRHCEPGEVAEPGKLSGSRKPEAGQEAQQRDDVDAQQEQLRAAAG